MDFIINQICRFTSTMKKNLAETLPWPATGIPRNEIGDYIEKVLAMAESQTGLKIPNWPKLSGEKGCDF